jgi:hypothetical protein
MHSPASNLGRRTVPSLKRLFAVMAGFLGLFVVLAALASATTNSQPVISQNAATIPAVVASSSETVSPVAEQQETAVESDTVAQPNSLTYGAHEIVKMYRGGIDTDVLLTFIETSDFPYQLSSKEILYLNKIGVPSAIVNAMIRRDHQVQLAKADSAQQAQSVSDVSAPIAPVVYSQPPVVIVQQRASRVNCVSAAPNCSTPVCASPNVTVIGSRYGSTFNNGCYYGPFSCSPARAYYNAQFGPLGCSSSLYDFGYGTYDGYRGGFGRSGFGRHMGRY